MMAVSDVPTVTVLVNGKPVAVSGRPAGDGPTLVDLLAQMGYSADAPVAVAVDGRVVPRRQWAEFVLRETHRVQVVKAMAGGAPAPDAPAAPEGPVPADGPLHRRPTSPGPDPAAPEAPAPSDGPQAGSSATDPLVIAGRTFRSRLFLGTGKYADPATMVAALERSGTEMVTVAMRLIDPDDPAGGDILAHIDRSRYHLLPNTAGATTAEQAIGIAHLAREALGTNWIKLEVIGDPRTLLPDLQGTLEATRRLVRDGFVVLPYCTADLVTCLRLEDAGAAAVMPLAAPIGTGQGMQDWVGIQRVIERVSVPVIVDAGLGVPSDAAIAMEMGASAVLVNTAIARAKNPPLMAEAFRWGVIAGRQAFLAGRMPPQREASASSPVRGVPQLQGIAAPGGSG